MGDPGSDDAELRALLAGLKSRRGLSYNELARRVPCSHGTAQNYLTKPGLRRTWTILDGLLDALKVTDAERARVAALWELTCPAGPDPTAVGWLARVRAANCTAWEMHQFSPSEASVHTAIGRHHPASPAAVEQLDNPPLSSRPTATPSRLATGTHGSGWWAGSAGRRAARPRRSRSTAVVSLLPVIQPCDEAVITPARIRSFLDVQNLEDVTRRHARR